MRGARPREHSGPEPAHDPPRRAVARHGGRARHVQARCLARTAVAIFGALFWGADGVASALYALAIVAVNFVLAAWLLAAAGRISIALMGAAALFGFLLRLALIFVAVIVVRHAAWISMVPLGITLIVTHLGLLFWELRYVSGSFAFPGLKPGAPPAPSSLEQAA